MVPIIAVLVVLAVVTKVMSTLGALRPAGRALVWATLCALRPEPRLRLLKVAWDLDVILK